VTPSKSKASKPSSEQKMIRAIREMILSIPRGKVATYGQVAEAAGYPRYHRQVAQVLNRHGIGLPWHRVLGAGGELKTSLESALDQRMRLQMEGVGFRGARVDMKAHGLFEATSAAKKKTLRRDT
jgi:methylated-DNA-protein-cysteine methyltransferase related protein